MTKNGAIEQEPKVSKERINLRNIFKSGLVTGAGAEALAVVCRFPVILAAIDCGCPQRGFSLGFGLPFLVGGAIGSISNLLVQTRRRRS